MNRIGLRRLAGNGVVGVRVGYTKRLGVTLFCYLLQPCLLSSLRTSLLSSLPLCWSGILCSPSLGVVIYDRFQSIQEVGQHWNPSIPHRNVYHH